MQNKILRSFHFLIIMVPGLFFLPAVLLAQFNTPVINAIPDANEYGAGNNNNYATNAGATTWYMTWDATYLYILVANANEAEAAIVYLDLNPVVPVNGGTAANGANIGQAYDGLAAPNLPFRADAILYVKNDYRELRRWDGGTWALVSGGAGGLGGTADDYATADYASTGGSNTRELRISWSRLTNGGGRPAAFNWNGYVAYNNGIYAQVPVENPAGTFPAASLLSFNRYLTVSATADNASTNPMSRNSYTHIGSNISNFGNLNVWDFTMNTADRLVSRATASNWNIANDFVVGNGSIFFNTVAGANTLVGGNLRMSGGVLDMDNAASNSDLEVNGDILLSGGILRGSNTAFSDIILKGNWQQTGAAVYEPRNRSIFFEGTSPQTLSGNAAFANLYLNNTAGLKLLSSVSASATVTTATGKLDLNGFDLTLIGADNGIVEDRAGNHFITDNTAVNDAVKGGRIIARARAVTNTQTDIAGLGLLLNDATGYNVSIFRYHYRADGTSMKKLYTVSGSPTATTLAIAYASEELAGIPTGNLSVYRRDASWILIESSPTGNQVTADAPVTAFSDWTLADRNIPLPVSLVRFDATRVGSEVRLGWETASEQNSLRFDVERSYNGQVFATVLTRNAAGFAAQTKVYQGLIIDSKAGWYRLKQTDTDGRFVYSPQVFVAAELSTTSLRIYPNPVKDAVQVIAAYPMQTEISVKLVNVQGMVVTSYRGQFSGLTPALNQTLPVLKSGVYFLHFTVGEQQSVQKMIKVD